ncbi:hypothetical protein BJ912DRAFT_1065110 [Pholiota molesta]|nr:hypothetical protein BJ912DRAFT_1065110 [Pholiota molesta]
MAPTTRNSNATSAASTSKGNNISKAKNKKATGKKATPTNRPANSIDDDPAHDPVLYKQFVDSLKKKGKKAAANETNKRRREQEDQIIQQKTAEMLEQENTDSQGDDEPQPPAKKKAKRSAVLSDDEQDLAENLSDHDPDPYSDNDKQPEEEEIEYEPEQEQEQEPNMDEDDQDKEDDGDVGFEEDGFPDIGNGHVYAQIHNPSLETATSTSLTGKVKRSDFPPNVVLLADSAKNLIRTRVCFGDWVLESDPRKQDWVWGIINDCPKTMNPSSQTSANQALQLLSSPSQQVLRSKLVSYGKGALFNSIVTKARQRIVGHYGLDGNMDSIIEKVEWLLNASHFIYGELNLKEKTYDANKPFGNPIIKELIQSIWFNTAKSKADVGTAIRMMKEAQIPVSIVFIIVSAIEHSIGEYKAGVESQMPFKELQLCNRYKYHQATWKGLQARSPRWAEAYPATFFKIISKSCNLGSIIDDEKDENVEDIQDVVGANLDAIVDEGRKFQGYPKTSWKHSRAALGYPKNFKAILRYPGSIPELLWDILKFLIYPGGIPELLWDILKILIKVTSSSERAKLPGCPSALAALGHPKVP